MRIPSPQDRYRISAETLIIDRTIKRAYEGKPCRGATLTRIALAAHKLGIEPPPKSAPPLLCGIACQKCKGSGTLTFGDPPWETAEGCNNCFGKGLIVRPVKA